MRLTRTERTPCVELISLPIMQDGLVDAIDTCRIFEDAYDFWDESGDGWAVLERSTTMERRSDNEVRAKFSSWFVQSSSPDIKAYYDKDQVSSVVRYASPGMLDSLGLLLELGPPGIVDFGFLGRTPLSQSIIDREHSQTRVLLALGANPHQSCIVMGSDRGETPLSLAMYRSWDFCSFRDALMEMNFHVKDIVRRELEQGGPLLDDGWQAETLTALLEYELDFEPSRQEIVLCSSCHSFYFFSEIVQPYWQDILERIKNGTYVQNNRSDTLGVQSSSNQTLSISTTDPLPKTTNVGPLSQDHVIPDYQDEEPVTTESTISKLAPGKEDIWCMWCWRHFKKTGRRYSPHVTKTSSSDEDDSPEDDFSPFLFNTYEDEFSPFLFNT